MQGKQKTREEYVSEIYCLEMRKDKETTMWE